MRSPAEPGSLRRVRRAGEWALRALLLLALTFAIGAALRSMREQPRVSAAGGESSIRDALREWSTAASPVDAHLGFDSTPSQLTRAWAASLAGAGTHVTWSSELPALGISVEPVADPKGASRILVSAPAKTNVALQDSLGPLDTLRVRFGGASLGPLRLHGAVRATEKNAAASAVRADSLVVRPILVLGRAGWEAKFAVASLEEYGWRVNARLAVSPGSDAIQGSAAEPIDTSNYSAVIVIDSSASRYAPSIVRYVRSGGGLIAAGEGAGVASLRALLPAGTGTLLPAGEFNSAQPRSALALRPLVNLTSDAVTLEKRGSRVAIAARRAGKGRVVQVGYEDMWRWRMAGGGDAVEDYRDWLSSVVSSAALAPRVASPPASADPAPLASTFNALGNPVVAAAQTRGFDFSRLLLGLFVLSIGALVLETASRRLDGRA